MIVGGIEFVDAAIFHSNDTMKAFKGRLGNMEALVTNDGQWSIRGFPQRPFIRGGKAVDLESALDEVVETMTEWSTL